MGRTFADGWGDEEFLRLLHQPLVEDPLPIEPSEDLPRRVGDLVFRDGSFPSPAVGLPEASRLAHFLRVEPAGGVAGTVVLLAAWGEHGYLQRLQLARRLAEEGLASLILENPFYGKRRPRPGQVIHTVAEFAVMGRAAVEEARSLMMYASDGPVGVSGFSMGANTAALAGAAMPIPVAIAPLAPSPSPGPVWTDGIISRVVDWEALGHDGPRRLGEALGAVSVLHIPPRPHTARAVLVGAISDGYIPREATEALHGHWPGSELRWVKAGHGTLIWRHKRELARAVVDSFARLGRG